MDRNKQLPLARGPKAKITQQPPDMFIALGAKQSSPRDDPKRTVPLPKTTVSSHLASTSNKDKLKREGSSSSLTSVPPSKKIKVTVSGARSGLPGTTSSFMMPLERSGGPAGVEPWEVLAADCEPNELFESIISNANNDKAIGFILGAMKILRNQRSKPCKVMYSSLLLACMCKPALFSNEYVVSAILSVMRRDVTAGIKGGSKSNVYVHILFINLLSFAYSKIPNWPESFVKLYVEDAVADRMFIDNTYCKAFVDNIITAFNTKAPPSALLKFETWTSAARDTSSPLTINSVEDDEVLNEHKALVESWGIKVLPRYSQSLESVEQIVLEAIKEQLARRQQPETITKNFVRFLSIASGLVEIRIIAVSRIETWLHNHKLMKPAQELLAYLCFNCSAIHQRDIEVILQLSKLRLKNKPMLNFFNNCLREMVHTSPQNLYPLMKYTIYNELSNARNTNNLIVVGALFQVAPENGASAFADICLELLLNKDDYLRSLRALLKEINRVLRHDFNLLNVVHHLLLERKEFVIQVRDHEFRERIFMSLVDLSCMCMLLCVSPQVRDAATQSKRDVAVLKVFQMQVSNIQRECVSWLHDSALRIYRPSVSDYQHALLRVLFLEQAEHYYKIDNWPGENERNLFLRLASEVPLSQGTLLRILLIGISKEHPISPTEIVDITDQLVRRAANLPADCAPPLTMDKTEIFEFFFNLCSYNYPENITLPMGYIPPKLAISTLYWKVWLILLILAAHNPNSFGSLAWDEYPILKMFMEMCITNYFSFPPPTMSTIEEDQVKEQQTLALEKQKILEFESHLAAASTKIEINEQTSLLLPQLIELRPMSEPRRPPQAVLELLQNLNKTHRMGHLLCRSRHPDFLLQIMSRQGGTVHMPWLADLVHSSEGVLAHLPVQCLCEYLLSTAPTEKLTKHGQLLAHLRFVVVGNDPVMACEVLEYLFRRLTSDHRASRTQATKGLSLILAPTDDVEVTNETATLWLTSYIKQFPHFLSIKPLLSQFLRQALETETNPARVSSYVNFLATQEYAEFAELNDLINDLSWVIIERHSVASYVIPGENNVTLKNLLQIFYLHLQKAKEYYALVQTYSSDYVIVSFANGNHCAMQPLVIQAAIVLLTYGPLDNFEPFTHLLNTWFPNGQRHPQAFTADKTETTSYLPEWLQLRMIRSNVSRLVDAAIEKLEPPKLVLFIQSFGIPTASISKLLHTLDKATLMDPSLVVNADLDKTYMIKLVEVQKNKRGASGGETFVKAIEMAMRDEVRPLPTVCNAEEPTCGQSKKVLPAKTVIKSPSPESNPAEIVIKLTNLFNPHLSSDKNKIILELIKNILLNKTSSEPVFAYIRTVPPEFTLPIIQQYQAYASLIRLILNDEYGNLDKINFAQETINAINKENLGKSVGLLAILQQFVKHNQKDIVKMELDPIEVAKSDLVTSKESENIFSCPENLGEKLGKILLEEESSSEKTGLLVDWLAAIELEIANSDKHKLQMNLLFSKHTLKFRPLMMSLVLQRATWKSLHGIMTYLLSEDVEDICPMSALDFFTALTKSPRLWQGRDKAIPKHHHEEDVLELFESQALKLVFYILEEAELLAESNWKNKMESRLELLLKCVNDFSSAITCSLLKQLPNEFVRELLLLIYMSLPCAASHGEIDSKLDISLDIYSKNCLSVVDERAHCLLSALAATPRSKDWTRKSQDLELCARKLAATHPVLVLRQLPMLAGSLKGRAQYDWGVLKSRGHLTLFGQIMGIMELLQPFIFDQKTTVCELLDSYFLLLQFHGFNKDLSVLVNRIVTFIQQWIVKDIKEASKYLQEHGGVFNDIQFAQPGVKPLLSSVSLPIDQTSNQTEIYVGSVASTPSPAQTNPNVTQLLTSLSSTDNLSALQDLDHLTHKKPELLENAVQYLYTSIETSNGAIRSLALTLMIRWLKFKPQAASDALPVILACLNSDNGDIVASILDKLSDIVAVMQEYAKIILTRVFQLGMKSTMNTTQNINKTVGLLCLQYGC